MNAPGGLPRPKLLTGWLIVLTAVLAVAWVTPREMGVVICGVVALYALRGPKESVQALTILAFLLILGKTDISLGRWLVLFAAFGRMVWDTYFSRLPTPQFLGVLYGFGGLILVFSLLFSTIPLISVLKITSFVVGVGVAVVAFYRTRHLRDYWWSWLFTFGVFIILASIPLYGLPEGYERNGRGFQGILGHPQMFGSVLAPITALLTGLVLLGRDRSWLVIVAMVMGWTGMYFSQARTGLLALVLALGLVILVALLFKHSSWGRDITRALGQAGRIEVLVLALFVMAGAALHTTAVQETVEGFLLKNSRDTHVAEILENSRGRLIQRSMDNFREEPVFGIGFGIHSSMGTGKVKTGPLGLPIAASGEKGFMPSAVLEETGIVGALLVLMLLAYLFAPVLRQRDPILFWMMVTCLLVNFGDMVFFSVGGSGFFFWMVMAFCYSASILELEQARAPREVTLTQVN